MYQNQLIRFLEVGTAAVLSLAMFSFMTLGEVRGGSKMSFTKNQAGGPSFEIAFTDYHSQLGTSFNLARSVGVSMG